jgi:hypothetical protein
MQPIDAAYERFNEIVAESAGYLSSLTTEADTRLKIIDRILVDVLHWPYAELHTEEPVPSGFADYVCKVQDRSRLVVEAKRDGRSLGCEGRPAGGAFKLSGAVFKSEAAKEGIKQAIQYAGAKNAELACVTNGREWIIFRGTRLGDGIDTSDGMAFVFSSLVDIEAKFTLFYDLLSYEAASQFRYRPHFQEAEGQPIRTSVFHKSFRAAGSARLLPAPELASDIDKLMSSFFQRLTGDEDPDLVRLCFVETSESRHADNRLAKIAEEIVTRITSVDTGRGTELTNLIRRVQESRRREFVLIVGTKGSGKSTFISRFFDQVLPRPIAEKCVSFRVDLRSSTGDLSTVVEWLDKALLREAEKSLFPEGPSFNDIEGMFFDEYVRLKKGPWSELYVSNKTQFRVQFGELVEQMRRERSHEYIQGLIRHVVNSRLALPVVVFDNADHFDIDFQQRVYQYARSIYEECVCLVILPITDRTSWQLSKHGALQSFEHEALYLPTPPTGDIIRKRIEFIEQQVESKRERPEDRYFIERGISLRLDDLAAFARSLQRIFLQTHGVSRWIGDLANHDVRRTLNLVRSFIGSPHLRVVDLVKAFAADSAVEIPTWRVVRAIIRLHYDIYPAGQHDFVQNVFALNDDLPTTPLLGLRLLQLLSDVPEREHEGAVIERDEIVAYFAGMNIEDRAVLLWLDAMLQTGLLLNYDPTVQDISKATRVEISPAGRQHAHWANGNIEYLSAMTDVTPLLSEAAFVEMRDKGKLHEWRDRTIIFLDYMLKEDAMYCTISEHEAYQSQRRIRSSLEATLGHLRDQVATHRQRRPPSRR